MPIYFFHVHDGRSIPDAEGTELRDRKAAQVEAVHLAGVMLRDDRGEFWNGDDWRIQVTDETGRTLFTLRLLAEEGELQVGEV